MAKQRKKKAKPKTQKAKTTEPDPAVMGRPRVELDIEQIGKLANCHCTIEEIAGFFGCGIETVKRRVKEQTGLTFERFRLEKEGEGRSKLRAKMFEKADSGDTTMLIWVSKNILGWSDRQIRDVRVKGKLTWAEIKRASVDKED